MGFTGITIWPFIFLSDEKYKTDKIINHEKIHLEQQKEMLIIFFYLLYLIEWFFKGYRKISFELEAYNNEDNLKYLETRKRYNWWNLIWNKN